MFWDGSCACYRRESFRKILRKSVEIRQKRAFGRRWSEQLLSVLSCRWSDQLFYWWMGFEDGESSANLICRWSDHWSAALFSCWLGFWKSESSGSSMWGWWEMRDQGSWQQYCEARLVDWRRTSWFADCVSFCRLEVKEEEMANEVVNSRLLLRRRGWITDERRYSQQDPCDMETQLISTSDQKCKKGRKSVFKKLAPDELLNSCDPFSTLKATFNTFYTFSVSNRADFSFSGLWSA